MVSVWKKGYPMLVKIKVRNLNTFRASRPEKLVVYDFLICHLFYF